MLKINSVIKCINTALKGYAAKDYAVYKAFLVSLKYQLTHIDEIQQQFDDIVTSNSQYTVKDLFTHPKILSKELKKYNFDINILNTINNLEGKISDLAAEKEDDLDFKYMNKYYIFVFYFLILCINYYNFVGKSDFYIKNLNIKTFSIYNLLSSEDVKYIRQLTVFAKSLRS